MRAQPVDQGPAVGHSNREPAGGDVGGLHGLGVVDNQYRLAGQGLSGDQGGSEERPDHEDGGERLEGQQPGRTEALPGDGGLTVEDDWAPPQGAAHGASRPARLQEIKSDDRHQRDGGDAGEGLEEGHWHSSGS